jgi:hypothetical protein
MVQFQDSISKCLHHHTLSSMFFYKTFEAHCAQILSCSSLGVGVWYIAQPIFPNFFYNTSYVTWTTPSFNCKHPSMCLHTSHRPYGYPLLTLCSWQRTHLNPWCNLRHHYRHCVIFGFHVGWEQLHVLPSTTFNSSCWQVDIVFTKIGIHTLTNVVIINPTWVDLFFRSCTTQGITASNVIQTKERSYCN